MTKKRRNGGRSKMNRGCTNVCVCEHCGRSVQKDKAIKRYTAKNLVEAAALNDMREATVYEEFAIPKLITKASYCVSCAMHLKVVRVRSEEDRKTRYQENKTKTPNQKPVAVGK